MSVENKDENQSLSVTITTVDTGENENRNDLKQPILGDSQEGSHSEDRQLSLSEIMSQEHETIMVNGSMKMDGSVTSMNLKPTVDTSVYTSQERQLLSTPEQIDSLGNKRDRDGKKKKKKKKRKKLTKTERAKLKYEKKVQEFQSNKTFYNSFILQTEEWLRRNEEKIMELSKSFDVEQNGLLLVDEYRAILKDCGISCTKFQLDFLLNLVDVTQTGGTINYMVDFKNAIQVEKQRIQMVDTIIPNISHLVTSMSPKQLDKFRCRKCGIQQPRKNEVAEISGYLSISMKLLPQLADTRHPCHVTFTDSPVNSRCTIHEIGEKVKAETSLAVREIFIFDQIPPYILKKTVKTSVDTAIVHKLAACNAKNRDASKSMLSANMLTNTFRPPSAVSSRISAADSQEIRSQRQPSHGPPSIITTFGESETEEEEEQEDDVLPLCGHSELWELGFRGSLDPFNPQPLMLYYDIANCSTDCSILMKDTHNYNM